MTAPATTPRPPAILFDLDGTLIDSIELIVQAAEHAFAHCGRDCPPRAEWTSRIGTPLVRMFEHYVPDPAGVAELIAAYREFQYANHDRLVTGYDRVVETVGLLKGAGHSLGIVTSKTEALARRGLEHVGILQHFDTIVGFDATDRHKPDPEPVRVALERLGCGADAALFVGDSVFDVEAGNAAGTVTVAALWGPFSREELARANPTYFLESITGLPALVRELASGPAAA